MKICLTKVVIGLLLLVFIVYSLFYSSKGTFGIKKTKKLVTFKTPAAVKTLAPSKTIVYINGLASPSIPPDGLTVTKIHALANKVLYLLGDNDKIISIIKTTGTEQQIPNILIKKYAIYDIPQI